MKVTQTQYKYRKIRDGVTPTKLLSLLTLLTLHTLLTILTLLKILTLLTLLAPITLILITLLLTEWHVCLQLLTDGWSTTPAG